MNTQSGYLEINGAKLYYEEAGSGPAFMMCHAGIADHRMWDDQFAYFADRFRVIRFDWRGFGKSNMPRGDYALHKDLYEVMRALNVDQAILMGCSMGGAAVIDFTIEHPEMVMALIPVGSGLSGFEMEGKPPKFYEEMNQAKKAGDYDQAAEYAVRIWFDSSHRTPEQMDPALRRAVFDMVMTGIRTPENLGKRLSITPPAFDRLETIKAPTFVIVGDYDNKAILQIAEALTSLIRNTKKLILTGTAHLPNLERPQEFNQMVDLFLQNLGL